MYITLFKLLLLFFFKVIGHFRWSLLTFYVNVVLGPCSLKWINSWFSPVFTTVWCLECATAGVNTEDCGSVLS